MKSDDSIITVPIVARMRKNEDTGEYELVKELSIFAEIPAEAVARFIMEGLHISFEKLPFEEAPPPNEAVV